MNKKLAIVMLSISFLVSYAKAETDKKYAFRLVQEAEQKLKEAEDRLTGKIDDITKKLDIAIDKEDYVKLSEEDKRKLKFLLHQVIQYK